MSADTVFSDLLMSGQAAARARGPARSLWRRARFRWYSNAASGAKTAASAPAAATVQST